MKKRISYMILGLAVLSLEIRLGSFVILPNVVGCLIYCWNLKRLIRGGGRANAFHCLGTESPLLEFCVDQLLVCQCPLAALAQRKGRCSFAVIGP